MNQIKPSTPIASQTSGSGKGNAKVGQGKNLAMYQNQKKSAVSATEKKAEKTAEQAVDKYLTLVSRLENQIKKGELTDQDLDKILTALEKKILSMPKKAQEQIQKIKEYKEMEIEGLQNMKEEMKEMLLDEDDQGQVIRFLKNKEFITLISEKPSPPKTYAPQNQTEKQIKT